MIVRHVGIEATGLKIMALMSPSMARPPYRILYKSTIIIFGMTTLYEHSLEVFLFLHDLLLLLPSFVLQEFGCPLHQTICFKVFLLFYFLLVSLSYIT